MVKFIQQCVLLLLLVLVACSSESNTDLIIGVSADYPPFEYKNGENFTGFDIELVRLIAQKMNKNIQFVDSAFPTLLPLLQNGKIDMAISCITRTPERENVFSFSQPYFFDTIVAVYNSAKPFGTIEEISKAVVGVQLGTTMQEWAKSSLAKNTKIITMDTSLALVEALKAKHIDVLLLDKMQGYAFMNKNPNFAFFEVAKASGGYAIAFKKNSPYINDVNGALESLKKSGALQKLEDTWLVHGQ